MSKQKTKEITPEDVERAYIEAFTSTPRNEREAYIQRIKEIVELTEMLMKMQVHYSVA